VISSVANVDRASRSGALGADHEVESTIVLSGIWVDKIALVFLFHLTGKEIKECGIISRILLASLFAILFGCLLVHSVVKIQKAESHHDENDKEVHNFEGYVSLHFELIPVLMWQCGFVLCSRSDVFCNFLYDLFGLFNLLLN
jgi:hypothetical protein